VSDNALLESLNPAQREAVLHTGSPLLILAGAGSGKTRVITVKIAYLIDKLQVDPRSILAVTFTNKAAAEMKERAAGMVGAADNVMIRTFHSFGAWLLRRNAAAAGLSTTYAIYDDDDVVSLLRTLRPDEQRGYLSRFARLISRAKDYCLGPSDDLFTITNDPEVAEIYMAYDARMREIGNVDFGDLILKPVHLLDNDRRIRDRVHQRFRYILVDEYQDSNVAQYELLKRLVGPGAYVCVVGDDDQSIYRFRGAEVRNILTFDKSFPNTTTVRLEQNYRSTAPILNLATAVVSNNEKRLGKELWTERKGGSRPVLALLGDQDQEVEYCARLLQDRPLETAILYRTNAQSRLFESAFLRSGIPYRIVGTIRFYEREEIKDALSLLRLIANPKDEVAFRRVVNKPARGIGQKSIARIAGRRSETSGDLLAASKLSIPDLSTRGASGLRRFVEAVESAAEEAGTGTLAALAERVLREVGLWDHHVSGGDPVIAQAKTENLEEFINAASLFGSSAEGLAEFLEAVELDQSREQGDDLNAAVTLITMHNTKGLEFDRVIVTGLEEGLFPRSDDDPVEVEEERRLFYVAVTRAREELFLTSCSFRLIHGRSMATVPSRFLGEIPRVLLDTDSDLPGLSRTDDDEYPRGSYVYHDDYGTGVVLKSWHTGRELVVQVQFETGRVARFLPAYTSLEKVDAS
jgi:DNA helicase-2/ATP-dependent DNA helicase PcrA